MYIYIIIKMIQISVIHISSGGMHTDPNEDSWHQQEGGGNGKPDLKATVFIT